MFSANDIDGRSRSIAIENIIIDPAVCPSMALPMNPKMAKDGSTVDTNMPSVAFLWSIPSARDIFSARSMCLESNTPRIDAPSSMFEPCNKPRTASPGAEMEQDTTASGSRIPNIVLLRISSTTRFNATELEKRDISVSLHNVGRFDAFLPNTLSNA